MLRRGHCPLAGAMSFPIIVVALVAGGDAGPVDLLLGARDRRGDRSASLFAGLSRATPLPSPQQLPPWPRDR